MFHVQMSKYSRPSLKHIFLGILGGSIGLFGAVLAIGIFIVETLIRPKKLESFYDIYTMSPFELNLPAEEVEFDPLHGDHKVSGWYVPHPTATTTIIMCPGYRGKRADVLGLCVHLWKDGHNILVFEYYGHGAVVGKPITLGYREINDFLGAVIYAKQRAPEARLGAVGYSMGGAVSIMACARTNDVEALVTDSAFATHRSAVAYAVRRTLHLPFAIFDWATDLFLWLRAGYRFHQVEPLRDVAYVAPRPILIIQGLKDTIVHPHDASLLYKAARSPKELWLIPEADHCGAYFIDRVTYVNKIIGFFDLYLKKSHPPIQLNDHKTGEDTSQDHGWSEAS